ncbi:MAG: LacI family DNA-binding transcriptional regulator [Verrucomicrobiota bacterium]
MAVTIKEIAKVAGVCHTTVSRALNDNPVISPGTTARIQRIAREMGYVPNVLARSLQTNKTGTIGMVLTTMTDPFLPRIVEGVERRACQAKHSLFVSTSHNNPDQEIEVIENLYRRRVDAIIIASMWVTSTYFDQLSRFRVPMVLINHQVDDEALSFVGSDDVEGVRKGVHHLIELGHRRIGFLKPDNRPPSYSESRIQGYRKAFEGAGIEIDRGLFLAPGGKTDLERGERALGPMLAAGATAVFCYNDLMAVGLLKACREEGVSVPGGLSVVGFDDLEMAGYVSPGLTTLHQSRHLLGEAAMQTALDLLSGMPGPRNQILPCDLVVRQSTGPPGKVPVRV